MRTYAHKILKCYFLKLSAICFLALLITACQSLLNREPLHKKITKEDIADIFSDDEAHFDISPSRQKKPHRVSSQKYPEPSLPKAFSTQRLSIFISPTIPLRNVLYEMGTLLGTPIQLNPSAFVSSQTSLNAQNESATSLNYACHKKSAKHILTELAELLSLRISYRGGTVFLEKNLPYSRTYSLQFLNLTRDATNHMSLNTDVHGTNNIGTKESTSRSEVTVANKNDFWAELEQNIKVILSETPSSSVPHSGVYALHKQGGLLSVTAFHQHHMLVENYLEQLKQITTTQVLIEAKIIEVSLNDKFRAGIDWQKLNKNDRFEWVSEGKFGQMSANSPHHQIQPGTESGFVFGKYGGSFRAALHALSECGTQRILSSPRITVMHNHTAFFKVAQNQVYFKLNYDNNISTNSDFARVSVSSDIKTVPVGLVLSVQPSVDLEQNKITLFLNPTISRMTQAVSDPAVEIAANDNIFSKKIHSKIPVLDIKEMNSVLCVESGDLTVLGGLIERRSYDHQNKVPLVGDIPVLGEAFQSQSEGDELVELVILLRATILPDGVRSRTRSYHPFLKRSSRHDRKLYRYISDSIR